MQKYLAAEMLLVVSKGGYRIEYGELSNNIKKKYGIEIDPHLGIKDKIGEISELCYNVLNLPMLSAVVVNNQKNDRYFQKPGAGFYALYDKIHGTNIKGNPVFEEKLLKQVREDIKNCNEWYKLTDYLSIEVEGIVKPEGFGGFSDSENLFPEEINSENLPEGAVKTVLVNKYERNPKARIECIKFYGTQCKVCGLKFSEKYGLKFENKIHVHHIKPISEIGKEYQIDPIKDLIPVCPNCHMVLHSKGKNEVYTIEE